MDRNGVWRLAHDLTFAQGPGGEHSTSVLGRGKDVTKGHLTELGRQADLDDRDVGRVVERVEAAVADWKSFAADHDVGGNSTSAVAAALDKVKASWGTG